MIKWHNNDNIMKKLINFIMRKWENWKTRK